MNEPRLPADLPAGPSDHTTMTAVIEQYEAAGFEGQFEPLDGPAVRCSSCGAVSPASSVGMRSMRRLEGASDPADMAAVAAVVCPSCGTQGILVVGFGPASEPTDADVFAALRDRRHDTPLPADAAPGETPPH